MIFYTAWYFSIIYILGMFIIYLKFPKNSWKRFFGGSKSEYTKDNNKLLDKIRFLIINLSWWGIIFYSFLVPVKYDSTLFYIGVFLFVLNMILYEISLFNYASTPIGEPVRKGLYKISRNPQYICDFFIWIGVGIMCSSYWILIIKIIGSVIQHWTIVEEEHFCLEKYGEEYKQYLDKTPRYLLFF